MARFTVTVVIDTDTAEHAQQVIAERINHDDDDYGFEYTIGTMRKIKGESVTECAAETGHAPSSDHRWQECPGYAD